MQNFIEDYVNGVKELLEYEATKRGFVVTEDLIKTTKKEFANKLENSEMLWVVTPYSDAAYSIADDLFTECIDEII